MFLPTTIEEVKKLGWDRLDVILVSGDTYIDSSYSGTAVIGKVLLNKGFKVGVIAQPDVNSDKDIKRLGVPNLFWGVNSGSVDSMVANYTATKKRRQKDDFTPGGDNNRRPDRASIVYTNLIRKYFKDDKRLIVLGGIEASLRRIVHYDFWTDKLRKSILFNAKADILCYGMGEKSIVELANAVKQDESYSNIRGLSYISKEKKEDYIEIPSFEECKKDKYKFIEAFNIFYVNNDPITAKGLCQKQDDRYLIQNPPALHLSQKELDEVYNLEYERAVHPYYKSQGEVRALSTIRNSITTHRGCYGECNFCAIAVHQGRTIIQRSEDSIIKEARELTKRKDFKGNINDVGGPTGNMYGIECSKKIKSGACKDKRCISPTTCKSLNVNHSRYQKLLERIRNLDGVKKVFVTSGIRYDLIMDDKTNGDKFLRELIKNNISGQIKIAPEHTQDKVLKAMGKTSSKVLKDFKNKFDVINKQLNKKQFLTYYLIAAHPGCNMEDMKRLKKFASEELSINPEQVQIFTPTPSTYSTLMYYTGIDPFTNNDIFVEKDIGRKQSQKDIATEKKTWSKSKKEKTKFTKKKKVIRNTKKKKK